MDDTLGIVHATFLTAVDRCGIALGYGPSAVAAILRCIRFWTGDEFGHILGARKAPSRLLPSGFVTAIAGHWLMLLKIGHGIVAFDRQIA